MRPTRLLLALPAALALSACAGSDPAGRAASVAATPNTGSASASAVVLHARYAVQGVNVVVPKSLKVSEANMFYPVADIVWRGEPRGDRYAQVQSMVTEAASRATGTMSEGRPVNVTIEITRFHCLTEKTRYTVGGTHALHFRLTVTDAATGMVLEGPRDVVADVKASGGAAAIAEEQAGRTQRVVVVDRLTDVIRRELSTVVTDPEVVARALMASQTMPVGTN